MGKIYSETKFYVEVKEGVKDGKPAVQLRDQNNTNVVFLKEDLNVLTSGDDYIHEVKVSRTELNKLILDNPRVAMTINFDRIDKDKTTKLIKEEREAQISKALTLIEKAQKDKKGVTDVAKKCLEEITSNPVQTIIKGENTTLKGYHLSTELNSNGYLDFMDMETIDEKTGKYGFKQVNFRGSKWAILNNTKYIVK